MNIRNVSVLVGLLVTFSVLTSCATMTSGSGPFQDDLQVSDASSAQTADEITEGIRGEFARSNWVQEFRSQFSREPVVLVTFAAGTGQNTTLIADLATRIEQMVVREPFMRLVASSQKREMVRQEQMDQQTRASDETLARLGQEAGADFILVLEPSPRSPSDRILVDFSVIQVESTEVVFYRRYEHRKPSASEESSVAGNTGTNQTEDQSLGMWQVDQTVDSMTDEITTVFWTRALRGHENYMLIVAHVAAPNALLSETVVQLQHPRISPFVGDVNFIELRFDEQPLREERWRLLEAQPTKASFSELLEPQAFLENLPGSRVLRLRFARNYRGSEFQGRYLEAGFAVERFEHAMRSSGLSMNDLIAGVVN